MALVLSMTVCVLVYAALAYRLRTALKEPDAPCRTTKASASSTRPHAGCAMTSGGCMGSPSRDKAS